MRVVFIISEHPLHNRIVSDYCAARPDDHVAVVKVPLVLKGKSRAASAQRVLPQLSRRFLFGKVLEYFMLRLLPMLPRRPLGPITGRLRHMARELGLPFHKTDNVMGDAALAFIGKEQPDVIVTLFHQIVKLPLIALARLGIVNIHPGLLPEMRGIQPYYWALAVGARRAGATLHLIEDETIDTGRILARSSFAIHRGMSVQLVYYLSALAAAQMLPACLADLAAGRAAPLAQDATAGAYYRWPDSQAADCLWRRGHDLFASRQLMEILYGRWERMPFSQEHFTSR